VKACDCPRLASLISAEHERSTTVVRTARQNHSGRPFKDRRNFTLSAHQSASSCWVILLFLRNIRATLIRSVGR